MNHNYINKEWLKNQYITLKKSSREIAKECSTNKTTILYWLKELNIQTRTISEAIKGEKNGSWKGNNVGITALHRWIKRNKIKSEVCELCENKYNKNGISKLELSNIDHRYKRNIEDYQWVHHSCHEKYHFRVGLKEFTKEHRKKLSEKAKERDPPNKGKKLTIEHKKKLSKGKMGNKNPMYGKKQTEEIKKQISDKAQERAKIKEKCSYCNKEYSISGLGTHKIWCKENPNQKNR